MRVRVKICGLSDPGAIDAAAAAGADAIGFVFAPSPRRVTLRRAAELVARVPDGILRVAVFGPTVPARAWSVLESIGFDAVQADVRACLVAEATSLAICPVLHDGAGFDADLAALARMVRAPRYVLFESRLSGSGTMPDQDRAADLARRVPLALAGGLTPDNVAAAIARVRPAMVDVSSGVESSPGRKDPHRITAFVAAARGAAAGSSPETSGAGR